MNNIQDIRWIQRFQQFEKSYQLLIRGLNITHPNEVERAGIIQFFEMTFEISWKLLKDYLENEGYQIKSPRDAVKQSFQIGLITDGHVWMNALEDRNLTTHTYNEQTAIKVEMSIRHTYYPMLTQVYNILKKAAHETSK